MKSSATVYLDLARDVVQPSASTNLTHGVAELLHRLLTCHTSRSCAFYYFFLVSFFGLGRKETWVPNRVDPWVNLFANFTSRIRRARTRELSGIMGDLLLHPQSKLVQSETTDVESVLLVHSNNESYAKLPLVKPFVRHLGCYAAQHGMRFVKTFGDYTEHVPLGKLDVFEPYGHIFALGAQAAESLHPLIAKFRAGQFEQVGDLARYEDTLHATCEHRFQKVFAIAEHLDLVGRDSLLIYYDMDVTFRPDATDSSLPRLLLDERATHGQVGHVFIADAWPGADCVNGGFIALRNTNLARLFLQLWLEKRLWPLPEDQIALAETILEIVGAERSMYGHGRIRYNHHCLELMFPTFIQRYLWARYCDCWQDALTALIGPYRQRQSNIVRFVDPEYLEVNFVPNSLFSDHGFTLSGMRLQPQHDGRPALEPFAIHWAGLKPQSVRYGLMKQWLATQHNLSIHGCPRRISLASKQLGTNARHLRCCEWLRNHRGHGGLLEKTIGACLHGCCAWQPLSEKLCDQVLTGSKILVVPQ